MERKEIFEKLSDVFKDVFDNDDISINENTVAGDVEGWDSLMHITLIGAVEDEFDVKFSMREIVGLKNVGSLVDLIEEYVG